MKIENSLRHISSYPKTIFGRYLLLCILLGVFPGFSNSPHHAFYVSISELSYEEKWGDLTLKVKVFTNDLEDALVKRGSEKLYLNTQNESPNSISAIANYLFSKVKLQVDQKPVNFLFVKKEYLEDACWIYLRSEGMCQLSQLSIESHIFLELFDTQTNIVRVKAFGQKKIANLDGQISKHTFDF